MYSTFERNNELRAAFLVTTARKDLHKQNTQVAKGWFVRSGSPELARVIPGRTGYTQSVHASLAS